ncbi:MAG: caspase family protein [Bacteroidales bacterium]|nr:caspase family protein [Bacteroidales bacterium]MCF8390948.1 caspase family protein [Bacteroidales bacterium]
MKNIKLALLILAIIPLFASAQSFTYKEKKELKNFPDYIMEARFSPYRNYFAVTVGNNSLELYDKDWNKIFEYQGDPKSVGGHLSFSPDEKYLAYAKYKTNNDVAVIDLDNLKVIENLKGHSDHIQDINWNHAGTILATCSQDKTLRIWNFDGSEFKLLQVLDDHEKPISGLSFSFDDKYLASCGNDSKLLIYEWNGEKYKLAQKIEAFKGYLEDCVFHPSKYRLLLGNNYGTFIIDSKKNTFFKADSLDEDLSKINNILEYSPTGDYFFHGSYTNGRVWKETGNRYELVESIYRHTDYVFGGTFSDDGKFLCTFGSDRQVVIWEVEGLTPSNRSLLVDYLGWDPSLAQKKILTPENTALILSKLDKSLIAERDEFETTDEFNRRRSFLSAQVLYQLQNLSEIHYNIKKGAMEGELFIPVEEIIGYNADLQIYKIRFMDTEAGVKIPVNEARSFKDNWEKAIIRAEKTASKNKISMDYGKFELVHPVSKKSFEVTPVQNPFAPELSERRAAEKDSQANISTVESKDENEGRITKALFFGGNIYDSFSDLVNPIPDAAAVSAELGENYNVSTELVENAGLNDIMKKLREYAAAGYGPEDNLLIYFAGHGEYDPVFQEGYVIARDSKMDDPAKTSYLSHSNMRTIVNNIPCNHIFLVMDVCFGGTFDPLLASSHRGADLYAEVSPDEFVDRKMKYKTRLYLTSGGKEYVPDGRPGHHSPFTRKFLEALRQYGGNDKILTVYEVLQFLDKVEPQPRFGEFGDNEPGSDFILIAR